MNLDERGPDLLAHLLGQLPEEEAAALDAELETSAELRAERDSLAETLASYQQSAPLVPAADGLTGILSQIEDEAAARREQPAAAAATPVPEEVGGDLTALALGQLDGADRARVEGLVAATPELADELGAIAKLVEATRAAAIEPAADGEQQLLRRVAKLQSGQPDLHDSLETVPVPGRHTRKPLHILRWLAPLATAAALLLAFAIDGNGDQHAHVQEGHALLVEPGANGGGKPDSRLLGPKDGRFEFTVGSVVEASEREFSVNVDCGPAKGGAAHASGRLEPGQVEFVLGPGSRLERLGASEFELLAGRARLTAGPLENPLVVRHGELFARVVGTEFETVVAEGRLVAVVRAGNVELGRRGGPPPLKLSAGRQGLVDADRQLELEDDGRPAGDAFLTPGIEVALPTEPLKAGEPLPLTVKLTAGRAGAVKIAGFDPSLPIFLVRLKSPSGQERDVKVQSSMVDGEIPGAGARVHRLTADEPYELRLRLPLETSEVGTWHVQLRYLSYRRNATDGEWLGVVEGEVAPFEVRP